MDEMESLLSLFGKERFDVSQMKKDFKSLPSQKQKRLMFMVKAEIYGRQNNDEYYTGLCYYEFDFNEYKLNTPFYWLFDRINFFFNQFPNISREDIPTADECWERAKNEFFIEFGLDDLDYPDEYEAFIFGLKLRMNRNESKEKFALISGLSRYKIDRMEDVGYEAKLKDVIQYVEDGLKIRLFADSFDGDLGNFNLKNKRKISKTEFSKKTGLTVYKISQIEQHGIEAKLGDIFTYFTRGLEVKWNLQILKTKMQAYV